MANYHASLTLHQAAGVEIAEKVGPDAIVRKRLQSRHLWRPAESPITFRKRRN